MMRLSVVALTTCLSLVARGQQQSTFPDALTLFSNQTALAVLYAFLEQNIDLASQYNHLGNVTFLAPSNNAFVSFQSSSSPFNQPSNRTVLSAVLSYHTLQGQYTNVTSTTFAQSLLEPTAFTNVTAGQSVKLAPAKGNVTWTSGQFEVSNQLAGPLYFNGGVVYIIDKILTVPQEVSSTLTWDNLTESSGAFNLTGVAQSVDSVADVTIFAPSNAGIENVGSVLQNMSVSQLTSLMQYHVVVGQNMYSTNFGNKQIKTSSGQNLTMYTNSDGSVFVNNAKITQTDLLMSNGVIHIIDNMLNPNVTNAPSSTAAGYAAFANGRNIGALYTNEPQATSTPALTPTNSTSSSTPTPTPASSSNSHLSAGVIAAAVLASVLGLALIFGAIFLCRRKGYKVTVSRHSVLAFTNTKDKGPFELPPDGGFTEKVELPASDMRTVHSRNPSGHFSRSNLPEGLGANSRRPEYGPDETTGTDPSLYEDKPFSPVSPQDGIWEGSSDMDARQRIERFLRPHNMI